MHAEFWLERWQQGQIGFHMSTPHPALERHFRQLQARPGETVFVPLCGKSHDLEWLASQGLEVRGVELSGQATQGFFEEQGRAYREVSQPPFLIREDGQVHLYTGDYFALRPAHLGTSCRLVYDRAALIALPPEMRRDYVEQLGLLLPHKLDMLLITLEYPQAQMQGPPFSVAGPEVRALFEPRWQVSRLESRDILAEEPRFRDKGLTALAETVYLIQS